MPKYFFLVFLNILLISYQSKLEQSIEEKIKSISRDDIYSNELKILSKLDSIISFQYLSYSNSNVINDNKNQNHYKYKNNSPEIALNLTLIQYEINKICTTDTSQCLKDNIISNYVLTRYKINYLSKLIIILSSLNKKINDIISQTRLQQKLINNVTKDSTSLVYEVISLSLDNKIKFLNSNDNKEDHINKILKKLNEKKKKSYERDKKLLEEKNNLLTIINNIQKEGGTTTKKIEKYINDLQKEINEFDSYSGNEVYKCYMNNNINSQCEQIRNIFSEVANIESYLNFLSNY